MIGTKWLHEKSGGIYQIVGLALEEATLALVVVYAKDGKSDPMLRLWTRPASEFFDGRFTQCGYTRYTVTWPGAGEADA